MNNLKIFYKAREKVITLFDDYTTIVSKAKCNSKYGKWLKILTAKQRFKRLLIALAQVKAGSTSKKLQSSIRQIIYFLYWAKEITK